MLQALSPRGQLRLRGQKFEILPKLLQLGHPGLLCYAAGLSQREQNHGVFQRAGLFSSRHTLMRRGLSQLLRPPTEDKVRAKLSARRSEQQDLVTYVVARPLDLLDAACPDLKSPTVQCKLRSLREQQARDEGRLQVLWRFALMV